MDLNIREHIINNFQGDNYETLKKAIDESVTSQDEVTLPGLGVFFEIIWENADQELKNTLIEIIRKKEKFKSIFDINNNECPNCGANLNFIYIRFFDLLFFFLILL